MKQFDEFWESWKYDPASIDEAFEECFKAGMLAAADMVSSWRYSSSGEVKLVGMIEDEIRNACKDEG